MAKRLRDEADWSKTEMISIDVGVNRARERFTYDGYFYKNEGELRMAMLLQRLGIPYRPDVAFWLELPSGRIRTFVADFVFEKKAYVWTKRKRKKLIHGIEVKGKVKGKFSDRALQNVALLRQQRGINILLLSNATIRHYFGMGAMPISPFDQEE